MTVFRASHTITRDRVLYALSGLVGRLGKRPKCPGCGSTGAHAVDRKFFHQLMDCSACHLLYRFPRETENRMLDFYQKSYRQPGLTTDLPDADQLAELLKSNFVGTVKDFGRFINLFQRLNIPTGARLLDFGANWGYGVHQFNKAGFQGKGFEISAPRAVFGRKLGLEISTDWKEIEASGPFDVAFSAHVLEHTPDPAEAMKKQIAVLRPGGWLIAVFPQGSPTFREKDFTSFHQLWGRVHPVLPTAAFLEHVLPTRRWFIGSMTQAELERISRWNGQTPVLSDTAESEMLVIYRNSFDD